MSELAPDLWNDHPADFSTRVQRTLATTVLSVDQLANLLWQDALACVRALPTDLLREALPEQVARIEEEAIRRAYSTALDELADECDGGRS